jgi:hypothetical protein
VSDPSIAVNPRFDIVTPKLKQRRHSRMEALMSVDMSQGNKNMDYAQHQQTYALFTGLVKYGSMAVIAVLVLMAIFLA